MTIFRNTATADRRNIVVRGDHCAVVAPKFELAEQGGKPTHLVAELAISERSRPDHEPFGRVKLALRALESGYHLGNCEVGPHAWICGAPWPLQATGGVALDRRNRLRHQRAQHR